MNTVQQEPIIEIPRLGSRNKPSIVGLQKISIVIVKELFVLSLFLYLILFILENIFPGFVSNEFNLNWILAGVVVLGVISTFSPSETEETLINQKYVQQIKKLDYIISIFLAVIGGLFVYVRMSSLSWINLLVAAFAALLILVVSIILLTVKEEEVKEKEEKIEGFVKQTFLSKKTFLYIVAFTRILWFKRVNFPVILIFMIFLFTASPLTFNQPKTPEFTSSEYIRLLEAYVAANNGSLPSLSNKNTNPQDKNSATPLTTSVMVKIYNGSVNKDASTDIAKLLKNAGFTKVFFGDVANVNYKNAEIRFRPEESVSAEIIKELLSEKYSLIKSSPSATSSAEIVILLGDPSSQDLNW